MFNYNYLIKYPFSKKAKEYLDSQNIDLLSVDDKLLETTKYFLTVTILEQNHEKEWYKDLKRNYELEAKVHVNMYPLSKIFLSIIDYSPINQSLANYYQTQLRYFLQKAFEENRFDEIESVLEDLVPTIKKDEKYYIDLIDLLSLELGDDYKLQYSNLNNGKIYFTTAKELIDFVSVVLKKRILRTQEINKKEIPKIFLEYADLIKQKYFSDARANISFQAINKPKDNEFPPCFLKLYNDILEKRKLSHIANFHLAVFLSNVGYNYDEILYIYKNLPNFDEKIAGYQIKKIIEKKYSVANCDNLKSNGLCVMDCKVKHPLQLMIKNKIKEDYKKNVKKK